MTYIASSGFITLYISVITPSDKYLSDCFNANVHLSMLKPFVHLIGPPLNIALDTRISVDWGHFVQSRCQPNTVLYPVLCHNTRKSKASQHKLGDGGSDDDTTLTFGIFALRDLKANKEVVLSREWDDGSVVHHLPVLIDSPYIFPYIHPHGL